MKIISLILSYFLLSFIAYADYAQSLPLKAKNFLGEDVVSNVTLPVKSANKIKYTKKSHQCLSEAIYYEARGEGIKGAKAVAEVVLNRKKSKRFPNNICNVVYQKYRHICQFSFVCNGVMKKRKNIQAWKWAQNIATDMLSQHKRNISGGALFFHADYVRPKWAKKMYKTAKIGSHNFYRNKR